MCGGADVGKAVAEPRLSLPDHSAFLASSRRDMLVANGIQKVLGDLGWRTRQLCTMRMCRDDADLTVNPDLWETTP